MNDGERLSFEVGAEDYRAMKEGSEGYEADKANRKCRNGLRGNHEAQEGYVQEYLWTVSGYSLSC